MKPLTPQELAHRASIYKEANLRAIKPSVASLKRARKVSFTPFCKNPKVYGN